MVARQPPGRSGRRPSGGVAQMLATERAAAAGRSGSAQAGLVRPAILTGKPAAKTPELLTIGYEGTTIGAVLDTLSAAGVGLLIDVRALPRSRKPGFSKRQ